MQNLTFTEIDERFKTFPWCKKSGYGEGFPIIAVPFECESLSIYKPEDIVPTNGWIFYADGVFVPGVQYALWKFQDRFHLFLSNGQNIILK